MTHPERSEALHPRLQSAPQVRLASLGTILIAQMDFDPCDALGEISQRRFDESGDIVGEFDAAVEMVVGADLYKHGTRTVGKSRSK